MKRRPRPTSTSPIVDALLEALEWYADPAHHWTRDVNGGGYHQTGDGSMERFASQVGEGPMEPPNSSLLMVDVGGRAQRTLDAYRLATKRKPMRPAKCKHLRSSSPAPGKPLICDDCGVEL